MSTEDLPAKNRQLRYFPTKSTSYIYLAAENRILQVSVIGRLFSAIHLKGIAKG